MLQGNQSGERNSRQRCWSSIWHRRMKRTDCPVETESGCVVVQLASEWYLGGEVEGACGLAEDGEVAEGGRLQNRRR